MRFAAHTRMLWPILRTVYTHVRTYLRYARSRATHGIACSVVQGSQRNSRWASARIELPMKFSLTSTLVPLLCPALLFCVPTTFITCVHNDGTKKPKTVQNAPITLAWVRTCLRTYSPFLRMVRTYGVLTVESCGSVLTARAQARNREPLLCLPRTSQSHDRQDTQATCKARDEQFRSTQSQQQCQRRRMYIRT